MGATGVEKQPEKIPFERITGELLITFPHARRIHQNTTESPGTTSEKARKTERLDRKMGGEKKESLVG